MIEELTARCWLARPRRIHVPRALSPPANLGMIESPARNDEQTRSSAGFGARLRVAALPVFRPPPLPLSLACNTSKLAGLLRQEAYVRGRRPRLLGRDEGEEGRKSPNCETFPSLPSCFALGNMIVGSGE